MNQPKETAKFIFILLFMALLYVDAYGQAESETETKDSLQRDISHEDGKNYATTYYYYIHSLYPVSIEKTLIDTLVQNPYNEDISLFSRSLYANLGIFGRANYSMNFSFYRKHGFIYKTLPYNTYLRTIENWRFYLPEEVYANLQYNFVSGKENHFSVAYAQQITEDLYFGLGLESIIAEGRYIMQKIRDVNLGITLRYHLPSNRYGFSMYYLLNLVKNQENGGIEEDSLFENGKSPSEINVRFSSNNSAYNHILENTFFLRHYLALSGKRNEEGRVENKIGYLVHDMEFESNKNLFDALRLDSNYFPVSNFNRDTTSDLVKHRQIRNTILWSSYMPEDTLPDKKNFIRLAAGIMYTFIKVEDTLSEYRNHQLAPLANLYVKLFNRLHIKANALITLNGYNAGDITVDGQLALDFLRGEKAKHQIKLDAAFYNYSPDYFFTHLTANNYMWENELKKQQALIAGVIWEHKKYSMGVHYYTLNNYTLLDENCLPAQIEQFVNVYQFAAYVPFYIKGFGINANIYLQYADNERIRIPTVATRQTVYYGFPLFKRALFLQFGLDFLYNTAYYANGYNPVLQQFYLQNDKKTGNYGYLDFFLRAKINRFQLQFKLTHLWAGLFGKNYYFIPHYPAKDMGFALGILWRFYD
ncbi:MAG: putative porin [Bacteroidales bacterium]|nr:putative porin [Bacteroidales bacterium]